MVEELGVTIALPMIVAFGLLYWSSLLDDEQRLLKLFFRLLFLPLALLSIHFAVISATLVYASDADLVETLGMFAYYLGWVIFIVGVYICYEIFREVYLFIKSKREAKKEDMYE